MRRDRYVHRNKILSFIEVLLDNGERSEFIFYIALRLFRKFIFGAG